MILRKKYIIPFFLFLPNFVFGWGFNAHQQINRYAVFTLPYPLFGFYKQYIGYITKHSVDPDNRKAFDRYEGTKHYIDLDHYCADIKDNIDTMTWEDIERTFADDEEQTHGSGPYSILQVKRELTNAFKQENVKAILRLSSDIGHYIADANVPLHTTKNYDGQETGQNGIHALWETRLPELFKQNYDYFVGTAHYETNPTKQVWLTVLNAYRLIDALLKAERETSQTILFGTHTYEQQGSSQKRKYSYAYSYDYHQRLCGQVEQQMLRAIKMLGNFWYTCWVDAGQPELYFLNKIVDNYDEEKELTKDNKECLD